MNPRRSSVNTIECTLGGVIWKNRCMSASAGAQPFTRRYCWMYARNWPCRSVGTAFISPDDLHFVRGKFWIGADQRHAFRDGLRDQQPVKRIAMMKRHLFHRDGVRPVNR